MAIQFEINTVASRHESDVFGSTPTIDASGSTVLVQDEDQSAAFTGVETDVVVDRPPSVGSIATTTSVTIISGMASTVLTEGTEYDISGTDTIDFTLGTAPYGAPGATDTVLITYETTADTYTWSLLDSPDGSGVSVVATGNPAIVQLSALDLQGSYLVQLLLDDGLDTEEVDTCIVSLDTYKKGLSIVAAGEESEYDSTKGWQKKIEEAYLGISAEGTYYLFTIGSESGADYTTFSDFVTDVTTQDANRAVGLNKFGEPFPDPANNVFYVAKLLQNLEEDITVPDGVVLNGNWFGLLGESTSPQNPVATITGRGTLMNCFIPDTNKNPGIGIQITTSGTSIARVNRVLISSNLSINVSGPAYVEDIRCYDTPITDPDLEVGTADLDEPAFISSAALNNLTITGGTVYCRNVTVSGDITINDSLGSTNTDVYLNHVSSYGNLETNATVTGTATLLGYLSTGLITNNNPGGYTIDNYETFTPTLDRDLIEPGGVIATGTDIALTNVSFIHSGGSPAGLQSDFDNLMIFLDGLLMTNSTDPDDFDGKDCRPGSTGGHIQFNFDVNAAMVIQVIRNV